MSIETLSILLREYGWFLDLISRGKKRKRYAYAKKRVGKQVLTRYLKAESKLADLAVQDVLKRIRVEQLECGIISTSLASVDRLAPGRQPLDTNNSDEIGLAS